MVNGKHISLSENINIQQPCHMVRIGEDNPRLFGARRNRVLKTHAMKMLIEPVISFIREERGVKRPGDL